MTVLLFATARVAVGRARVDWPIEGEGVTARALVRSLGRSYPKLGPALRTSRFVLNGRYLTRLTARYFPTAHVIGADFTEAMLHIADARTRPESTASRVGYLRANARRLPVPAESFDVIMSAFVARNLVDLPGVFREFRRVLRPQGTVLTLEITEPSSPLIGRLFHAYFDHVVPWLGAAVQSAGPYRYLPNSLRSLPPREGMVRLMQDAGFPRVETHPQSMGIVTTYLAGSRR